MAMLQFLDLTDDVLSTICQCVSEIEDLKHLELACSRLREIVACYDCWARLLYKKSSTLRLLVEALPSKCDVKDNSGGYNEESNGNSRQIITKTMLLKYTAQCVLSKNVEKRLKLWPLCPTTIDNPEEHIGHLLSPIVRSTRSLTYWSSAGSGEETSCDSVTFKFDNPLTLVTGISLRPFLAWFQRGNPVFAPAAVRFRLGGIPCFHRNQHLNTEQLIDIAAADIGADVEILQTIKSIFGNYYCPQDTFSMDDNQLQACIEAAKSNHLLEKPFDLRSDSARLSTQVSEFPDAGEWNGTQWRSKEYTILGEDSLQEFRIPPILCINGYLRIDLLGKTCRQEMDELYYCCLARVCCSGYPIQALYIQDSDPVHRDSSGSKSHMAFRSSEFEVGVDPSKMKPADTEALEDLDAASNGDIWNAARSNSSDSESIIFQQNHESMNRLRDIFFRNSD